jgi:hypothetical protein
MSLGADGLPPIPKQDVLDRQLQLVLVRRFGSLVRLCCSKSAFVGWVCVLSCPLQSWPQHPNLATMGNYFFVSDWSAALVRLWFAWSDF